MITIVNVIFKKGTKAQYDALDIKDGNIEDMLMFQVREAYGCAIDCLMLVDLTEAFGAGKEPDQAWCDENIPYFEGSLEYKSPTVDEALRTVGTALAGSVRIASGSYTGTGTYGASNPNVLTFGFEPDAVFVFEDSYVPAEVSGSAVFPASFVAFLRGGASVRVPDMNVRPGIESDPPSYTPSTAPMYYTISGCSISWYNSGGNNSGLGPKGQKNVSGSKYHYIAIGRGRAG